MELEAVRQITQGKRCLLLGGTCREENRRKIEEALQLSELVWPSTKPSDPLSKFDTEIRHADIVALLTRFSRKEWKNAQDICAREGKEIRSSDDRIRRGAGGTTLLYADRAAGCRALTPRRAKRA